MGDKNYAVKELVLDGLTCMNCAAKIEALSGKIDGVESASLNFSTKTLSIKASNSEIIDFAVNSVEKIVKDLEPHVVVREKTLIPNKEGYYQYKNIIIRLSVSGVLFIAALLLKNHQFASLILFLASYITAANDVLIKAFKNILRGEVFDENLLMCIATLGAFALKEFPEGVAVMLFYQSGELFQSIAVNNSRRSISALLEIRPDYANKKIGEKILKVSPEDVQVGDIIIVKPGEKVPLDGVIVSGSSFVDTSALTGESVPKELKPGDDIYGGFINKNSLLEVNVTKSFGDSTISKILDLVQNAASKKAATERFITRFARYYTPAVIIFALGIATIPPLLMDQSFSTWLNRALIFLVVSCPCALVISIPLGFFAGIGTASKNGILIKGSNYLEALNNIDTVIFDKTGTLTKGTFKVTGITALGGFSKEQLIELAAHAEYYSTHPIAASIIRAYNKDITASNITDYNEISGKGIHCFVNSSEVLIGTESLLKQNNIDFEPLKASSTIVYVSVNNIYVGYIEISDEIKEDSITAITNLKEIGIKKIAMLTGDNSVIGNSIAKALNIDVVFSELLPHQKVEKLELLTNQKDSKGNVIFVGDGINDAPVLARADVGISMGGLGSDAAIEASDIVLMTDEPSKIATAINIAKFTHNIVWQNIIFSIGVKVLVMCLSALGIATMWEAVFADVGVTILAVLNSMRILKMKFF